VKRSRCFSGMRHGGGEDVMYLAYSTGPFGLSAADFVGERSGRHRR